MTKDGVYIIPLNFGYEENSGILTLYFHGASEGKKIDLIKQQNTASFEMDTKHQLVEADVACSYSYLYQSIMGKGEISLVYNSDEKIKGLECVMSHYSNSNTWKFNEEVLKRIAVIKIEVTEWSCKNIKVIL
ncbi:MAG: pyridoxamine 5'-phosphate oxidase family protein [Lachnospirales bacterium]